VVRTEGVGVNGQGKGWRLVKVVMMGKEMFSVITEIVAFGYHEYSILVWDKDGRFESMCFIP
jgi:hypothetical protein